MLIDLINSQNDKNTNVNSVNKNYISEHGNSKSIGWNKKMVSSNLDSLNCKGNSSNCNCYDNNIINKISNESLCGLDVRNKNTKTIELITHKPILQIEGEEFLSNLEPITTPFPKAFNSQVSPIYEEYIQPNNDIPFK